VIIPVGTRRLLENDRPCKSPLICLSNRLLRLFRLSSQGSPLKLPLVARLQRRAPSGLLTAPGSWQEMFWAPLGLNGILSQHEILQRLPFLWRLPFSGAYPSLAPTFLRRLPVSGHYLSLVPSISLATTFLWRLLFSGVYLSLCAYLSLASTFLWCLPVSPRGEINRSFVQTDMAGAKWVPRNILLIGQ
jgi:hypothetical protein